MAKRIRSAAKIAKITAKKYKKIDVSPTKDQKKALEKAKKYGTATPKEQPKKQPKKPAKGKK